MVDLPEHVVTFAFSAVLVFMLALIYRYQLAHAKNPIIPDRKFSIRNVCELYAEFISGQISSVMGEEKIKRYFPFISFIFLFILINNLIGFLPHITPATSNVNTTFAFSGFVFLYFTIDGIRHAGLLKYIKNFAGPIWYLAFLIFPIEVISNIAKPVSLALRLRGNIYGDHAVIEAFLEIMPFVVPIAFMLLGLLVAFLQAFVFTLLTIIYIKLSSEH